MRFRKKPVEVEAEQFFNNKRPWPDGVVNRYWGESKGTLPSIKTLEGWYIVSECDWIVTGIVGEKWAVRADIFEMTYERIED